MQLFWGSFVVLDRVGDSANRLRPNSSPSTSTSTSTSTGSDTTRDTFPKTLVGSWSPSRQALVPTFWRGCWPNNCRKLEWLRHHGKCSRRIGKPGSGPNGFPPQHIRNGRSTRKSLPTAPTNVRRRVDSARSDGDDRPCGAIHRPSQVFPMRRNISRVTEPFIAGHLFANSRARRSVPEAWEGGPRSNEPSGTCRGWYLEPVRVLVLVLVLGLNLGGAGWGSRELPKTIASPNSWYGRLRAAGGCVSRDMVHRQ